MATENVMFRALITQKNTDGSIRTVNGVPQIGGVVEDRLGEKLGYIYEDSKYDKNMNRKPEYFVYNWYREDK
jgi:hypothetical protein